ncbi:MULTISPECIES: Lrp/AsnC family transcriptional regulator [Haloferax]|uniref:Lrp/AsnC family transcriptional regulator n=1 Tax=Haloferax marinum TaxID=2666143 RepID=A0A6A8G3U9_9EURY|nr:MULTISPECIES: Lrp/AsnC ligand binding domain-containing protein [Haloferax]KAB1196857.1 Lrp/AsnC family transcriptional regulator [Haloferax sp. CBA1150]MRW95870.1 Lrp/AsnC family transcriptional regulator [Haloferax marinum]
MVQAYVTIQTGGGTSQNVVEELRELGKVRKANIVAGEVDVIAEVEAESEQDLLRLISDEIQSIDGVGRTRTCIILG